MPGYSGELFALMTAVCWVASATFFEAASKRIGSLVVNLIRLWIAVLLLGIVCWVLRGMFWPSDASQHTWLWISLSGVLGFFLCDAFLFRAYVLAGSRRSVLMLSMSPLFAAIFDAVVLLAPPSPQIMLGMLITLAGVVWVVIERGEGDEPPHARRDIKIGMSLGLAAASLQALGAVAGKKGMALPDGGEYDALAATFIRALAGSVCFALLLIASGRTGAVIRGTGDKRAMLALTLGAIVGPVMGVTFFMASLKRVQPSVTQTILAIMPILVIPVAHYVHRERVTWRAILGTLVSVVGLIILCWR
jgi:drug/metabolite transporter (DMT)-like permease